MAKNVATAAEVAGAQGFLKELGADATNNLLIIAVVAWMRQESGGLRGVIGNNPFNIRPGAANSLSNGRRKSKRGNGWFLTFATLEAGFRAAAVILKALAPSYGYGLVLAAAKRGDAVDFLMALAMSNWDAGHYGLPTSNHLLQVFATFTGLQFPAPKQTPKPIVKPKPRPHISTLRAPIGPRRYTSGFAARDFYEEKHHLVRDNAKELE